MFLILFLAIFFLNYSPILASDRNIFGLHLTQTQDINSAYPIINSSGADWGFATIVIRTDQLDRNTWQEFFDKCRIYHIIPIIRLATIMDNDSWKKPDYSDIDNLANFLNSLNWPTRAQHIIMFNEINHGSEWGGNTDPKEFADLAIYASKKFKSLNTNFFILSSPLDLAAPEKPPEFKSAQNIYKEIYLYKPEYFDSFDGLASHSYPNHGYIGTPGDTGQHSIRGYQWELNYIRSLGIEKTYPVFITETGWPHREGLTNNNQYYTADTSAKFLINAIKIWSNDPKVTAITPFIYNYPNDPFDHFSWLNSEESIYRSYQQIIDLPKSKNSPEQITKYELVSNHLPFIIFTGNDYTGQLILKNTGQSIWGEKKFCLNPQTTRNVILEAICVGDEQILPGRTKTLSYKLKITNDPDYQDKTFISWENLPELEITPINGSATIYSPKTSFKEKIVQFFQNMFI